MKLYELAYACRIYRGQFDLAYDRMCKALGPDPDLASEAQRDSLMRFLNDWRCRIPEKNFPALKDSLQQWAALWVPRLPDANRDIRSLDDSERARIGSSYEELLRLGAGRHFQDTAAAKTLHAIRPHTLPIWDAAIKGWFTNTTRLSTRTAGQTYSDFLRHVAREISELEVDAARLGHSSSEPSQLVHGAGGSMVKLVDESYWVTITDGHQLPTRDELEQWLGWISPVG
jgi:hypothetical protein